MKRFALLFPIVLVVSLVACAEREKTAEPVVHDVATAEPTVAPVQKDFGNKFQGLKIQKPLGGNMVDKAGEKGAPATAPAPAPTAPASAK
ncbi:MAG: hypothetical protein HYV09_33850 [Deltaproteobacteria bacterium]|nr:hypothetical protein [Deltaproteobacteria bacterium]